MTNFKTLINKSIKYLRTNKLIMTQEKFAEFCNISVNGLRNIEHNRYTPQSSTIDKICKANNMTPLELLSITFESTSKYDVLISRLKTLNDNQLNMVNGFIDMLISNKEK